MGKKVSKSARDLEENCTRTLKEARRMLADRLGHLKNMQQKYIEELDREVKVLNRQKNDLDARLTAANSQAATLILDDKKHVEPCLAELANTVQEYGKVIDVMNSMVIDGKERLTKLYEYGP